MIAGMTEPMRTPTIDRCADLPRSPQPAPTVRAGFSQPHVALRSKPRMIVVDDDSNDGSEAVVAELAADYDIRIVVRKGERGPEFGGGPWV